MSASGGSATGGRMLDAVIALWIVGMLALSRWAPVAYDALVQEDRIVEWWTVFLFAAAAVVFATDAWRKRRLGDAAVALFCAVAAGEEVSWGQRIFGFTPSHAFLERNAQQEANLHNLIEAFGQPKWSLIAVLVAYGLVLPAVVRLAMGARIASRVGLTVPTVRAALWFAVTIIVLVWYPVRLTGEWAEAIAGGLFLTVAAGTGGRLAVAGAAALALAIGSERAMAVRHADPLRLACARAEVAAILDDVRGDSASVVVAGRGRIHRRLFTLTQLGDVDSTRTLAYTGVSCAWKEREGDAGRRRSYGIDPWGMAYWVHARSDDVGRRVTVYSFGPNRRRDESAMANAQLDERADDDVAAHVTLPQ